MLKSVVRIFPQASCFLSRQQITPSRCPALLNLVKIQANQYSSALDGSQRLQVGSLCVFNTRQSSSVSTQDKEPVPDKFYSRISCELRSNDPAVMSSFNTFALTAAKHLGIEIGECYAQKKAHHERYTLLRSVHVVKCCRVQYEVRTYFRWMNFHKLTGSTADTFFEYIERNLPEGVGLKVTKYELQRLPSHFVPPSAAVESGAAATSAETVH